MIISRTGVPAVPDLAMPPGGSERGEEPTEVEGRGRGAPSNTGVGAKVSSLNMYCSQKNSANLSPQRPAGGTTLQQQGGTVRKEPEVVFSPDGLLGEGEWRRRFLFLGGCGVGPGRV